MSVQLQKNDRVRLIRWQLYKGESMPPGLASDQWTATVVETWGVARSFAKVKRDHDGRVLSIMETECERIGDHDVPARAVKSKKTEDWPTDEPVLF